LFIGNCCIKRFGTKKAVVFFEVADRLAGEDKQMKGMFKVCQFFSFCNMGFRVFLMDFCTFKSMQTLKSSEG